MLERAKGCLEHGGRHLFRAPQDHLQKPRLGLGFWSHGAGDIDLSTCWLSLLASQGGSTPSNHDVTGSSQHQLTAGISGGNGSDDASNTFLDFLYPAKTLDLLRKLNNQNKPASSHYITRRRLSGARRHLQKHTQDVADETDSNEYLDHLLRQLHQPENRQSWARAADNYAQEEEGGYGDRASRRSAYRGAQRETRLQKRQEATISDDELERVPPFNVHQAESLGRKWSQYLFDYDNLSRAIRYLRQNPEDHLLPHDILTRGQTLHANGRSIMADAYDCIRARLVHEKDTELWNEDDWKVAMRVFSNSPTLYIDFLTTFEQALHSGKAKLVMPSLVESLLEYAWKAPARFWKLYRIYGSWKSTLSADDEARSVPFWDSLLQSGRLGTSAMVENALKVITTSQQIFQDEIHRQVLIELASVIMSRPGYGFIDRELATTFYGSLVKLLEDVPDYETLHKLLRRTLFQRSTFRDLDGRVALLIFQNMARFGGYKGEERPEYPDLGRKLFWRLCRSQVMPGIRQVFSDLQYRKKDFASEYSYLLSRLSRAGQQKEFENLRHIFEERRLEITKQSEAVGSRTQWDLYHDMLIMYSCRYDVPAMLRLWDEMVENPDLQPALETYNIMISAHARSEDLDGAEEWFSKIVKAGLTPDLKSYLPFMSEAARRGEVETVRALTRALEDRGIPLQDAVVDCHLRALIQAGALSDAKNLVFRSRKFQMLDPKILWNRIIGAYASRGDRHQVNSLILAMKKAGISLTRQIRAYRMRMWCSRLNPLKAEHLLSQMSVNEIHPPDTIHYATVMKGWLDKRDPQRALRVFEMFCQAKLTLDWSMQRLLSIMLEQLRGEGFELSEQDIERYSRMINSNDADGFAAKGPFLQNNMDRLGETYSTVYFQFLASIAPGDTEVDRISHAWNAFLDYMESQGDPAPDYLPPVSVLTRLLAAYKRQQMWDRMDSCWNLIYDKAMQLSQSGSERIKYRRRHILCRPLYIYLQGLAEQNMLESKARPLIESLLDDGFELNTRCWNQYVRLMVLAGPEYRDLAFCTAEERLMPGWQGWPERILDGWSKSYTLRTRLLYYLRLATQRTADTEGMENTMHLRIRRTHRAVSILSGGQASDNFSMIDSGVQSSNEAYAVSDEQLGEVLTQLPDTEGDESPPLQPALGQESGQSPASSRGRDPTEAESADSKTSSLQAARDDARPGQLAAVDTPQMPATQQQQANETAHAGSVEIQTTSGMATDSAQPDNPGHLLGRQQQDERLLGGRPEYNTLVLLTRAFLDLRLGAAFDADTSERVRHLSRIAPTVVQAILTMPRVDDSLQLSILRRQ